MTAMRIIVNTWILHSTLVFGIFLNVRKNKNIQMLCLIFICNLRSTTTSFKIQPLTVLRIYIKQNIYEYQCFRQRNVIKMDVVGVNKQIIEQNCISILIVLKPYSIRCQCIFFCPQGITD